MWNPQDERTAQASSGGRLELGSTQWTAGESNPDSRRAIPVSSRWTRSPFEKVRPRIELGLPPYHGGVLPEHLQTGRLRVVPAGLEPAANLCVRQASWPLDDGTNCGQ